MSETLGHRSACTWSAPRRDRECLSWTELESVRACQQSSLGQTAGRVASPCAAAQGVHRTQSLAWSLGAPSHRSSNYVRRNRQGWFCSGKRQALAQCRVRATDGWLRHAPTLRQRMRRGVQPQRSGYCLSLSSGPSDGNTIDGERQGPNAVMRVGSMTVNSGTDGLSVPMWPPLTGLGRDIAQRAPLYWSDWKDGLNIKSVAVILFLYFACLAPIVAFGGITAQITQGAMGVVEFLISGALCGMLYHGLAGQPLTIVGPTGLTLAFTASLYKVCHSAGLPFLATYAWVGVWTAFFLFLLAIFNTSSLIRYCTRFTDDCFNALIAATFLYEAFRSIGSSFRRSGMDKTEAFMGLSLSLGTFIVGRTLSEFRQSRYLRRSVREFLSDFGAAIAIFSMTLVSQLPEWGGYSLPRLQVPLSFQLAGNRPWLVPMLAAPMQVRVFAVVPAILLTVLFFLDQNITVRVVNAPAHKLRKGEAYHLDLLMLSVITLIASVLGLPWMCAATVQSLNHVRSLAITETYLQPGERAPRERIVSVIENRLTGFMIHFALGMSLLLLPLLRRIPVAVISGLFLYMGRRMMSGNEFLRRIRLLFVDPALYPDDSPMRKIRPAIVNAFTAIQFACLGTLWTLKMIPQTTLFFPAVIGLLMVVRSFILTRVFSPEALKVLDGEIVSRESDENNSIEGPDDASEGVVVDVWDDGLRKREGIAGESYSTDLY
ncbi:solute carrier 4 [Cyanidiococcus yangmingshanensis]|uniref:Solute carrier 4 n=1 Tax=Cyanidiococcus yangmingshanensis TaxID=2690220 RepID=A0A7J7IPN3_9RHOD|nr:solute carrier 4 [Cyanidiococcus yangmingshanensis]